jgi:outer membrane protein assembly factor BamA
MILVSCLISRNPQRAEAEYEKYGKNRVRETSDPQRRVEFIPRIIFSYSKETSLVIGTMIGLHVRSDPAERVSSVNLAATYSLNRQLSFWLRPVFYWQEGEYKFLGNVAYLGGPASFYGIGNNTSKSDREYYTSRNFDFWISLSRKLFSCLYAGFGYQYKYRDITEVEDGGLLAGGTIPGSEGGGISGIGFFATWDSRETRDNRVSGGYHQFSSLFYGPSLESDYLFNSFSADMRYYQPLFLRHVLAFRGMTGLMTGEPPFQELNSLGNYLRGYAGNRFLDKHIAVFQAEYRLPLIWRFGLVGFAGFGQTAGTYRDVSFKKIKPAGGIGLRFAVVPQQQINLRVDLGVGIDEATVDIGIGEAF